METLNTKKENVGLSDSNGGLGALPDAFLWMTRESQSRMKNGGNNKGTVPVHGKRSATATVRLYTEDQVQTMRKRMEWQPADTAPKDGTMILVFERWGEITVTHWFNRSHVVYEPVGDLFRRIEVQDGGAWNCNHFEFWMPLPEAPNVDLRG